MTVDELRQMLQQAEEVERETVFEAAHAIGVANGRKLQLIELIQGLEANEDDATE